MRGWTPPGPLALESAEAKRNGPCANDGTVRRECGLGAAGEWEEL